MTTCCWHGTETNLDCPSCPQPSSKLSNSGASGYSDSLLTTTVWAFSEIYDQESVASSDPRIYPSESDTESDIDLLDLDDAELNLLAATFKERFVTSSSPSSDSSSELLVTESLVAQPLTAQNLAQHSTNTLQILGLWLATDLFPFTRSSSLFAESSHSLPPVLTILTISIHHVQPGTG